MVNISPLQGSIFLSLGGFLLPLPLLVLSNELSFSFSVILAFPLISSCFCTTTGMGGAAGGRGGGVGGGGVLSRGSVDDTGAVSDCTVVAVDGATNCGGEGDDCGGNEIVLLIIDLGIRSTLTTGTE